MNARELEAAARKQDLDNSPKRPPKVRSGGGFDETETVQDDVDEEIAREVLADRVETKRAMTEDRQDGDIGDDADAADAESVPDGPHGPAYTEPESEEARKERRSHQQAPHDKNRL